MRLSAPEDRTWQCFLPPRGSNLVWNLAWQDWSGPETGTIDLGRPHFFLQLDLGVCYLTDRGRGHFLDTQTHTRKREGFIPCAPLSGGQERLSVPAGHGLWGHLQQRCPLKLSSCGKRKRLHCNEKVNSLRGCIYQLCTFLCSSRSLHVSNSEILPQFFTLNNCSSNKRKGKLKTDSM